MLHYTLWNLALLFFACVLCGWALIVRREHASIIPDDFDYKHVYRTIAAAILIIGVTARAYNFGGVPAGINQDGAMAAVDAWALTNYGTDRFGMFMPVHFTAWDYGQMSVLMSYLMVPFMKLFGLNVYTARLPMLLVSVAGMWVVFKWTEEMFGEKPALFALAVIAINPWQIMQSRWALDCNVFPHFLLFGMYTLYLGMKKKHYLYISMVFFALTLYTYGIAFYSVPVLLIALCVYLLVKKRITILQAAICLGVFLLFAWPMIAMITINYFELPTIYTPFFTIPYFPNSMRKQDLLFFTEDKLAQVIQNAKTFFNVVVLQKEDLPWNYTPDFGSMYLFFLPLLICGVAFLCLKDSKKDETASESRYFLLAWLFTGVLTGLAINDVNINRINMIFYPIAILCAIGMYYAMTASKRKISPAIGIALMYATCFVLFLNSYFGDYAQVLKWYYSDGFGGAIVYADSRNYKHVCVSSNVKGWHAPDASNILTMFYLKTDALYFQGKAEKLGPDGTPLLPYSDRYLFADFQKSDECTSPNADTIYVLAEFEKPLFDAERFEFVQFSYFYVALPKHDFSAFVPRN